MIGRMKIYLKDSEYKKHKSTEKLHEIQYRFDILRLKTVIKRTFFGKKYRFMQEMKLKLAK